VIFPPDPIQFSMLDTVSWFGILFLLLETGLDFDFPTAWANRGKATVIAGLDIVIPMAIAFVPSYFLPERYLVPGEQRWMFALFMATAMTISAMPVSARIMHDLGLLKSKLGYLTMSALAINDIIGWIIFTIVLGLYARAHPSPTYVITIVGSTIGFAVLAISLGRRMATPMFSFITKSGMPEPTSSLTFLCILGMVFGAITQGIGIHALFGFFIAGIVAGETPSLKPETRRMISRIIHAIFVPLFFASIGLKMDFWLGFDLPIVLFVCIIGIIGRYLGAWVGGAASGLSSRDEKLIAIAHTPGGMMEIVVAVLALENNLITQEIFIAIVIAAVLSSVLAGPWMSWVMKRKAKAVKLTG
jgi:Kef-type K+ transport system membrane component KefB